MYTKKLLYKDSGKECISKTATLYTDAFFYSGNFYNVFFYLNGSMSYTCRPDCH